MIILACKQNLTRVILFHCITYVMGMADK